jgi:endonuclease/exonuclease/phosphatase (EEP) superfamily protein YafD
VAGDWNAKHTAWGTRLTTPKDRNLLNVIQQNNLNYMSTGEPTYWPTNLNKMPDLADFAITKGILDICSSTKSNLDISSDHSPIVITLTM